MANDFMGEKRPDCETRSFDHELDDLLVDQAVIDAQALRLPILDGVATVDQVLDWYYAHDPIARRDNHQFLRSLESGTLDSEITSRELADIYDAQVSENAAYILINSVMSEANPGATPDEITQTLEDGGFKALLPAEPHYDQLSTLFVAVECLANAVSMNTVNNNAATEAEWTKVHFNGRAAVALSDYIYDSALLSASTLEDATQMQEYTDLAIAAKLWESFGFHYPMAMLVESSEESLDEVVDLARTESFQSVITAIKTIFVDQLGEWKPTIKGASKGTLHEAIWILDANLSLLLHEELQRSYVQPARSRMDKPRINYPQQKRGFDAVAVVPTPGGIIQARTIPIQQKASSGRDHKGAYHQRVYVAEENNFQDVNVRRLAKKLGAYEAWIASGFDARLGQSIYEKYVLESVKEAIVTITDIANQPDAEYFCGSLGIEGRAARRRVARAVGKLAKRI